ncbi:MAG TPA: selenocysteine-specific translation elongation factor [Solirubrobacteraceae bacterium]|nr:selenocysteine-specific translation elongation factor [Solirubrobacteraceae bacterium]
MRAPLTVGTAGHIDHGKTALVRALTGLDTDRLPQERERVISIELGYASLALPSGRRLSLIDVPGHERFVRTMVAGATGIDLFLMVVAADDGVMPQTREHAAVLRALGVRAGVVAVTKCDLAEPPDLAPLFPDVPIVPCSARTGRGVADVAAALEAVASSLPGRAAAGGDPVLHVDRSFTIRGAGTVVTGTLWSGAVARGDRLRLLPADREVRVRGVQVHDEAVERAEAGQRVALNLVGVDVREVARGDVVATSALRPSYVVDAALEVRDAEHGQRVQVHHGTREAPARLAELGGRFWQLRLEQPLLARAGDRVVIRSIAPPDTLGGGTILDPAARRHGPSREALARLTRLARGEPAADPVPGTSTIGARHVNTSAEPPASGGAERTEPLSPAALAVDARLREAAHEPPLDAELGDDAAHLPALRDAGRVVRLGKAMHVHVDAAAEVRALVEAIVAREGSITLARLRDELKTSRKFAQAHLEHLDATRITLRRPDDSRVLRRRA